MMVLSKPMLTTSRTVTLRLAGEISHQGGRDGGNHPAGPATRRQACSLAEAILIPECGDERHCMV